MATTKSRINITTNPEVEAALKQVAKRDGVPVATKAAELISVGLTLDEDLHLAEIADRRSASDGAFVSHAKAWE